MTRLLPLMMLLLSALSALAVIPRRIYHIASPAPHRHHCHLSPLGSEAYGAIEARIAISGSSGSTAGPPAHGLR